MRLGESSTALLEPVVLQSELSVAFANFVAFEQSRALVEKGSPLECEPRWVHATQREPLGVARTQIVGAPHGLREAVVVLSVLSETETFVEASLHMLNAVSRGDLGYDPELSIIASDRYW